MDMVEQYFIPFIDRTTWLKERIHILHIGVRESKPPKQEQSFEYQYCSYKEKCDLMMKIKSRGNV